MYEETLRIRREKYPEEMDGIIILRAKHNYDAINALVSRSDIVMQTSDAEGMETRISDAIKHGKPVVISNRGGMKTQVVEGESGIVLDYDKPGYGLDRGATFMAGLLTDRAAYDAMAESTKRQARELNLREFTTTANVTRFLRIGNRLRAGVTEADKIWKMSEMVAARSNSDQEELIAA
jgi:glycosyltransferase involved in cell wall biosynthesis